MASLFALPIPASAQTQVWSATMTVGSFGRGGTDEAIGYSQALGSLSAFGTLSNTAFTIAGTGYSVASVNYGARGGAGVKLILDRALPANTAFLLQLGDWSFSLADATATASGTFTQYSWTDPGLAWTDGESVAVRLEALPTLSIEAVDSSITIDPGTFPYAWFTVSRTGRTVHRLYFRLRMPQIGRVSFHSFRPGESTVRVGHIAAERDSDDNPNCRITFALVPRNNYGVSATASEATVTATAPGQTCSTQAIPIANAPSYSGLAVTGQDAVEGMDDTLDFYVTLHPAATGQVTVDYASADGTATAGLDYTSVRGTLTFAPGETEKTVSVPIIDDDVEDSRETVRLVLSNPSGASITLNGQAARIWNSEEEKQLARHGRGGTEPTDAPDAEQAAEAPPGLAVADASVREAADAAVDFVVSLSRASASTVTVDYATSDGTATAGSDYTSTSGTLAFAAGEISKTVSVPVLDDGVDEVDETFTLTLSNPSGGNAWLADATATVTIENDDPMPRAWLLRFGRTVAGQAVDAIGGRMERDGGSQLTLGGWSPPLFGEPMERALEALSGTKNAVGESRSMTGRELLLRSSFRLSAGGEAGAPAWTAWGRVATGRLDADEDGERLDGSVTSGFVGVDYSPGRWLAGVALSLTAGEGDYAQRKSGAGGEVESRLTALYPYARLGLNDRLALWGLAGFGMGELELTPARDGGVKRRYRTDIAMGMGAVGARGEVITPSEPDGLTLALRSDAFWVRTSSDAVRSAASNLAASEGDASRVRLVLEGSRGFAMGGGTLRPSLELGLRHDGGDAETGTGVEAGAGLAWTGGWVTVDGSVRTLVAHKARGYKEWGATGAIRIAPGGSGRGLSLTVAPSWGAAGSNAERLWGMRAMRELGGAAEFEAGGTLEAELGYGLGLGSAPGVVTPYARLSLADGARSWRSGARWAIAPDALLRLETTRTEPAEGNDPVQGIDLSFTARW